MSSLFEQCRKDVSETVGLDCNGKGLCIFAVDKQRFGSLCQGQYFYLDVRYSCGKIALFQKDRLYDFSALLLK